VRLYAFDAAMKRRTVKRTGIACGARWTKEPTVKQELGKGFRLVSPGRHANKIVCAPHVCGRLGSTVNWKLSNRFCGVSLGRHTNKMVCAPHVCGGLVVPSPVAAGRHVRPTRMWGLGTPTTTPRDGNVRPTRMWGLGSSIRRHSSASSAPHMCVEAWEPYARKALEA